MKTIYLAIVGMVCVTAIGCSGSEAAQPESAPTQTSDIHADHKAEQAARELIRLMAAGEFEAAAKLTAQPDYMKRQIDREVATYGLEGTKERWGGVLEDRKVRSISESGAYAMILVERPGSDFSPVSSEIYRLNADGSYTVDLLPGPNIPCPLVREYYIQKGEPDGEAPCAAVQPD
ncbi:hypothetical protein [Erythrobacter crassostreae]|uniref:Uncharacterized protein n=1 Tax=Erythrobacter crassostreae TaxID=2828328 RepID=A0A9X1F1T9_9SPHN|nr:hypothetical protein [Erythrobacter crassostrea]MBV7257989.1 hypothetical protein [Erythrobacter crassostrea]